MAALCAIMVAGSMAVIDGDLQLPPAGAQQADPGQTETTTQTTTAASGTEAATEPGYGPGVIAISAGGGHTCALSTAGAAQCWGAETGVSVPAAVRLPPRAPMVEFRPLPGSVDEGGSGTFTAALVAEPAGAVTVALGSSDGAAVTVALR